LAINEQVIRSASDLTESVAKLQYAQSAILTIRRGFAVYRFVFPMEL